MYPFPGFWKSGSAKKIWIRSLIWNIDNNPSRAFFRKFDLAAPWEQFPKFREFLPAVEEIPIEKK